MSEITPQNVAALRRWANIVANITPYQRQQIAAVCDAVAERDARIVRLTAALEWVRNAGREARDGAMSDGMGVIAMLDYAEFGLGSMEATLPALPDDRDATITALREQIAGLAAALTDAAEYLWEMGDNNALARRLDALGAGGEVVRHEETP